MLVFSYVEVSAISAHAEPMTLLVPLSAEESQLLSPTETTEVLAQRVQKYRPGAVITSWLPCTMECGIINISELVH